MSGTHADAGGAFEIAVTVALIRYKHWRRFTTERPGEKRALWIATDLGWQMHLFGSRVTFVDDEGRRHSVADVLRLERYVQITRKVCAACGEPVPIGAYARRQRGARQDRRYCSAACRQRAYRRRRAERVS